MTINDNVSFDKIPSTDINGRCNPPYLTNKFPKQIPSNNLQSSTMFITLRYLTKKKGGKNSIVAVKNISIVEPKNLKYDMN